MLPFIRVFCLQKLSTDILSISDALQVVMPKLVSTYPQTVLWYYFFDIVAVPFELLNTAVFGGIITRR